MFPSKEQLTEHAKVSMESYLNLVVVTRPEYPSWRKGQTYFNVLADVRPDIAEKVRGTALDPFHNNDRVADFLVFVMNNWR